MHSRIPEADMFRGLLGRKNLEFIEVYSAVRAIKARS